LKNKKEVEMKKIVLSSVIVSSILFASTEISLKSSFKDYDNSKYKLDGQENTLGLIQTYSFGKIGINIQEDKVDLKNHPKSKTLEVEKYNLNYRHFVNDSTQIKGSYIKIIDNLAPTDQGKVYGFGGTYNIQKGLGVTADLYKSDYKTFDVNQYDLGVFKGFKIGEIQGKASLMLKSIQIDGDKYNPNDPLPKQYTFKDKEYQTTGVNIQGSYSGFFGGIGAFFGKRMFAVLDDGNIVQHHAMEQDKTYMATLGKKIENFDIALQYSFQNANELPENRADVDTKVTSLMLKYKF
jgi:hypothetical protein